MDTGTIGEYYTLCELWRNGYNAISSDSPRQNGWDILILNENSSDILFKLQVKCVNWEVPIGTKRTISGDFEGDYDYLVVVIINKSPTNYQMFFIPKSGIRIKVKGERNMLFDNNGMLLRSQKNISIETLNDENGENWRLFCRYQDSFPGI
jgi:hypothetical protein